MKYSKFFFKNEDITEEQQNGILQKRKEKKTHCICQFPITGPLVSSSSLLTTRSRVSLKNRSNIFTLFLICFNNVKSKTMKETSTDCNGQLTDFPQTNGSHSLQRLLDYEIDVKHIFFLQIILN